MAGDVVLTFFGPLFVAGAVVMVFQKRWGWAAAGAFDAIACFVAPFRLWSRRGVRAGEPVGHESLTVEVAGTAEAVSMRLRRALLGMGALWVKGSTISSADDRYVVEGGTGSWAVDRDAGFRVRATAVRADDKWAVTIESMNYVPTFLQTAGNQRNVAAVLRALLA